jgi:Peptidase family S41
LLAAPASAGSDHAAALIEAIRRDCRGEAACLARRVDRDFPAGAVLQAVAHPDTDTIRWAKTQPSIVGARSLDRTTRLIGLERFGRKVEQELAAALPGGGRVVIDLRGNRGGDFRRMLRVAGRLTGPVPHALRLSSGERARWLDVPAPREPPWRGELLVLVGPETASSGEVLAALLRRHAGARVLGERTRGKDHLLRVHVIDHDWRLLLPAERVEVPGESLGGGLAPDAPIPAPLAAMIDTPG